MASHVEGKTYVDGYTSVPEDRACFDEEKMDASTTEEMEEEVQEIISAGPAKKHRERIHLHGVRVSSLDPACKVSDLEDLFSKYGKIKEIRMNSPTACTTSELSASVMFFDPVAQRVLAEMRECEFQNRTIYLHKMKFKTRKKNKGKMKKKGPRRAEAEPKKLEGETYGLKEEFLRLIGINVRQLVPVVKLLNLPLDCTEREVGRLCCIAGHVKAVKVIYRVKKIRGSTNQIVDTPNECVAFAVMNHPVEAVQAISMLNGQMYRDQELYLEMYWKPGQYGWINGVTGSYRMSGTLPLGLRGVGMGLGADGRPLSNIAEHFKKDKWSKGDPLWEEKKWSRGDPLWEEMQYNSGTDRALGSRGAVSLHPTEKSKVSVTSFSVKPKIGSSSTLSGGANAFPIMFPRQSNGILSVQSHKESSFSPVLKEKFSSSLQYGSIRQNIGYSNNLGMNEHPSGNSSVQVKAPAFDSFRREKEVTFSCSQQKVDLSVNPVNTEAKLLFNPVRLDQENHKNSFSTDEEFSFSQSRRSEVSEISTDSNFFAYEIPSRSLQQNLHISGMHQPMLPLNQFFVNTSMPYLPDGKETEYCAVNLHNIPLHYSWEQVLMLCQPFADPVYGRCVVRGVWRVYFDRKNDALRMCNINGLIIRGERIQAQPV